MQQCGTCLWIYGADEGQPDFQGGRNDKGKGQHRMTRPRLNHVPTDTNKKC